MEIIPAILVKTREELIETIRRLEPHVARVHLDIADGIFVPNTTIDDLGDLETGLEFSVHLMVAKPENHIAKWIDAAVSVIFHVEATQKHAEVINAVRGGECDVGIALNPKTPWKDVEPWVNLVDFAHFMTVEPGFYGGKFVDAVVEKIKDFHYFFPDKPISVDGGVNPDTAPVLIEAGATSLVVGTYLYKNGIEQGLKNLQNV